MSEIKLTRRYPDSRPEDITDAYMSGFEYGYNMGHKAVDDLQAENNKLRDLCSFLYRIHVAEQKWQGAEPYRIVKAQIEELGVEV